MNETMAFRHRLTYPPLVGCGCGIPDTRGFRHELDIGDRIRLVDLIACRTERPVIQTDYRQIIECQRCEERKYGRPQQTPVTVDYIHVPVCSEGDSDPYRRGLRIAPQHVEIQRPVLCGEHLFRRYSDVGNHRGTVIHVRHYLPDCVETLHTGLWIIPAQMNGFCTLSGIVFRC